MRKIWKLSVGTNLIILILEEIRHFLLSSLVLIICIWMVGFRVRNEWKHPCSIKVQNLKYNGKSSNPYRIKEHYPILTPQIVNFFYGNGNISNLARNHNASVIVLFSNYKKKYYLILQLSTVPSGIKTDKRWNR